jgi:hypothetical protein
LIEALDGADDENTGQEAAEKNRRITVSQHHSNTKTDIRVFAAV